MQHPGFAHAALPVSAWQIRITPLTQPRGMGSWLLSLGVHTMIGIPTPEGHQIMARQLCAHLKKDNDD